MQDLAMSYIVFNQMSPGFLLISISAFQGEIKFMSYKHIISVSEDNFLVILAVVDQKRPVIKFSILSI
jgi:hypothetical protein